MTTQPPANLSSRLQQNRRAHAYLRRRIENSAALLLGHLVAWLLAYLVSQTLARTLGWLPLPVIYGYALALLHGVVLLILGLLPGWGMGVVREIRSSAAAVVLVLATGLLADALGDDHHFNYLVALILMMALIWPVGVAARSLVKGWLIRQQVWGVPAVVYGAGLTGQHVVRALRSEPGLGYLPVAFFDDDPGKLRTSVAGLPVVGPTSEVRIDAPVAIVAMPSAGPAQHVLLLDGALSVYRSVIVVPDLLEVQMLWATTTDLGGVLGIHLTHTLTEPWQRRLKRSLDLLAVTLSAPLWIPLCGILALLIWREDRQSPLFLQPRLGLGGHTFDTWKFRTMVPNAEAVLQASLAADPTLRAEWEQHFKLRRDPRITRIGHLLRKTSLDELPQLINVWRGEMSLVGPRPLPAYHQVQLPTHVQHLRDRVRPGMTGLWQVSGRSDAGNEGMIQLDPFYVRNWSIWLDLVILIRTFRAVIRSAGAY